MLPYTINAPKFKVKKRGRPAKYPWETMPIGAVFEVPLDVKYHTMEQYCYKVSRRLNKTFRLMTVDGDHRLYVKRID